MTDPKDFRMGSLDDARTIGWSEEDIRELEETTQQFLDVAAAAQCCKGHQALFALSLANGVLMLARYYKENDPEAFDYLIQTVNMMATQIERIQTGQEQPH